MPLDNTPFSDTGYMARLNRTRPLWSRPKGFIAVRRNMTIESSSDTTGNRTRNLPNCILLPTVQVQYCPVSAGNTFQDLPRLHEAADNIERYI
jgi:hypothetical protein